MWFTGFKLGYIVRRKRIDLEVFYLLHVENVILNSVCSTGFSKKWFTGVCVTQEGLLNLF